jgi:hypothetical protein
MGYLNTNKFARTSWAMQNGVILNEVKDLDPSLRSGGQIKKED